MKTEEIKKLALRVKKIGIAIYNSIGNSTGNSDFDNVTIYSDGEVYANFSYSWYGDTESESILITEDDMKSEIKDIVDKHKKKVKDEKDRKEKEKLENELKQKNEKEQRERDIYEKLKKKFEIL